MALIFLEDRTRQVVAFETPDCHMLVAACYELGVLERIKFESEHWVVTEIAECKGAVLLPLENLD